jgi:C4-dicarboxylate transporter, DctM subunit
MTIATGPRGTTVQRLAAWEQVSINATRRLSFVGVLGMLVIGVLATVDVLVFRTLLNAPIPGFNEILQTVFAVAIASVFASGLAERANLQVDILLERLGRGTVRWLEVLSAIALLATFVAIAWQCGIKAMQAGRNASQTTVLALQVAPFYWAATAFMALCVPVQLVTFLNSLAQALTGGDEQARQVPIRNFWVWAAGILLAAGALLWLAGWALSTFAPMLGEHTIGTALALFGLLWVMVLLGLPVSVSLLSAGLIGTAVMLGWKKAFLVLGSQTMDLLTNTELSLIPLFLMMGAFATVGGMSADIFRLAQATFGSQRGGLAMATIAGCAGFGALTGSSIATAATIGAVALPEMKKRGYAASLANGCVAAGATLGQLVPPSTVIVLYAILTEESIGKLYIAILLPAALSIVLYLIAIAIMVRLRPGLAPGKEAFRFDELLQGLKQGIGVLLLFIMVIGGIYTGIFTATEAAAIGAVFTFVMALFRGKLAKGALWSVASETTRSVAMLYLLIIGALIMSFFMALSGLPAYLTAALATSGMPPLLIIIMLVLFFILLGTVMDSVAVMIITAGVVAPLVASLGYDPIWWGVMMVVLVEIGVVTPPFGINLFVLKSFDPAVPIGQVYRGVLPFVAADLVKVILLIAFPVIATWLQSGMAQ